MSDVNGNPLNGTGSGAESDAQTANTNSQGDATAKLLDGTDATATQPDNLGETVFDGGENQPGSSQFKTVEDAEKSWKESQRYITELKKKLELAEKAKEGSPVSEAKVPVNGEMEVLKARLQMNEVFDDYETEHPDFRGSMRTVAREIIETYVRAGKSIKMDEAYVMARSKLTARGDAGEKTQSEQNLMAAGLPGGSGGGMRYSGEKPYQPSAKEAEILDSLPSLNKEAKERILKRMSGKR